MEPRSDSIGTEKALVRQQHATRGLGDEMLRHAAENQFAKSRMAICPRDNDTRTDVGSYSIQLDCGVPVPIIVRHEFGGGNTVARQPGHNVPDPRLGSRPPTPSFPDLPPRSLLAHPQPRHR